MKRKDLFYTKNQAYILNRKFYFACLLLAIFPFISFSQKVTDLKLIEYKPAPGQFINSPLGTPAQAEEVVTNGNSVVSLGSFGGYITFKVNGGITNDADHPYGIDFIIFGNAFENNSEPGIIQVQKDENGNGEPDGTWYEIAGSDHFFKSTIKNYSITYTNPGGENAEDVLWTDNQGANGSVPTNGYHDQPYYPTSELFPNYPQDNVTFTGTLVPSRTILDPSDNIWKSRHYRFGYADNTAMNAGADLSVPSNPYGEDAVQGAGGDGIDLNWAVDKNGNHVDLDRVDFIRIYTSSNTIAGIIGEVSTEYSYISRVSPNSTISAETKAVIMSPAPKQVNVGDSFDIEAVALNKGIPIDSSIEWIIDKPNIVEKEGDKLTFINGGVVKIKAALEDNNEIYDYIEVKCLAPSYVEFKNASSQLVVGEKVKLEAEVKDEDGQVIADKTIVYSVLPTDLAEITQEGENYYIDPKASGTVTVKAAIANDETIYATKEFNIIDAPSLTKVFLTIKSPAGYILTCKEIELTALNIDDNIVNGTYNFEHFTPLHAAAAAIRSTGHSDDLALKLSDNGNSIYISKLKYRTGSTQVEFNGYGGETTAPYNKSWIIRTNDNSVFQIDDNSTLENGDEVMLYYVDNINNPWAYQYIVESSEARTTDNVRAFQAFNLNESLENGNISSTKTTSGNQQVFVNGTAYQENGENVHTDANGKVTITFDTKGVNVVKIGEAEIKVDIKNVGIDNILAEDMYKVYPIPCKNHLTIRLSSGINIEQVTIYDLQGKTVKKENQTSTTISTEGLSNGLYMLSVQTNKGTAYKKIIIRK
ncbi:MAG: T9SS type A sorting domain-containing protein [Hyphomicrobiales bacterium]